MKILLRLVKRSPIRIVEAAGFEDALYMATDRDGMPWLSGGGCLTTRDFLEWGFYFQKAKHQKQMCRIKEIYSPHLRLTVQNMRLLDKHFVFYATKL